MIVDESTVGLDSEERIKFNQIAPYSEFQSFEHTIFVNRTFHTLLSIVLFFVAVKLWDRKRGMLDDRFRIRKKLFLNNIKIINFKNLLLSLGYVMYHK